MGVTKRIVLGGEVVLAVVTLGLAALWVDDPDQNSYGAWTAFVAALLLILEVIRRRTEPTDPPGMDALLAAIQRLEPAPKTEPLASAAAETDGPDLVHRLVQLRSDVEQGVRDLAELQDLKGREGLALPDLVKSIRSPALLKRAVVEFLEHTEDMARPHEPILLWAEGHGQLAMKGLDLFVQQARNTKAKADENDRSERPSP